MRVWVCWLSKYLFVPINLLTASRAHTHTHTHAHGDEKKMSWFPQNYVRRGRVQLYGHKSYRLCSFRFDPVPRHCCRCGGPRKRRLQRIVRQHWFWTHALTHTHISSNLFGPIKQSAATRRYSAFQEITEFCGNRKNLRLNHCGCERRRMQINWRQCRQPYVAHGKIAVVAVC